MTDHATHPTVTLGADSYEVVPQKHTRVKRKLGSFFDEFTNADIGDASGLMGLVGDKVYDVLKVFIDDLMPRWKWEGFATEAAYEADEYNEDADSTAPTIPQMFDALMVCLEVNNLDKVKALGNLIGPEVIRPLIRQQVATLAAASATRSLQSLPPPPGESDSTSSGTTDQTDPGNGASDSPSDDSRISPGSTTADDAAS